MNFTNVYYELKWGLYPFLSYENYDKTTAFINYLKDNNYRDLQILEMIESSKKNDFFSIDCIDDFYWENSLTKRDAFYYHSELRIQSDRPTWDPVTNNIKVPEYYLEMRMNYTMLDLLNYFYLRTKMVIPFRDNKRDKGALKHLVDRYDRIPNIEGIDFVLHLIDEFSYNKGKHINNPLDLSEYEDVTYQHLNHVVANSELDGVNKIIWRKK